MTPAYATLFNPSAASGLAVERLRETATLLSAEGMRGKELTLDEWVTIVDIDRVLPETPPPGRMAPLLRASGRVAARAAQIMDLGLAGNPLTTGERQSLDAATAFALSACRLVRARAKVAIISDTPSPGFAPLFSAIDAMRWSRWLYQVHADIYLVRVEFLSTAGWSQDSSVAAIRLDSDGMAVIDVTTRDPLLYAGSWDIEQLAERLAAGVEVTL